MHATNRLAGHHPGQRDPGVVGGDAGRIRAGRNVDALVEHLSDRWGRFGNALAISLDKIFALIGHAMLGCDAATEGRNAVDGPVRDGFGMVEEPVQTFKRNILVDLLEDIKRTGNCLVIRGVHAPWPTVLGQNAHHFFEFAFHFRRHFRTWLAKVLEVRRGEDQHFSGTVVTEIVVALLVFDRRRPGEKVLLFFLGLLGEEIIGQTHRHLVLVREFLNDLVVIRVVLEATACINHTRYAKTIELTHEMAGGVDLVVERQLRPLGQRRIKNAGVRLG
ncbi:hypothetical protein D3C87_1408710 [compost metagenome]